MTFQPKLKQLHRQWAVRLVALIVIGIGLLLMTEVLLTRHPILYHRANSLLAARMFNDSPLIMGLLFIYLGLLLRRRKYAAWLITTSLFLFYLFGSIVIRSYSDIIMATLALYCLIAFQKDFNVKSSISSNRIAIRNAIIALVVMLCYGTAGFLMVDRSAFGQEITFSQSVIYTLKSLVVFGGHLKPLTIEGRLLLDSLYLTNIMTLLYIVVTFFGPIKEHFIDQTTRRQIFAELMAKYSLDSEDFFKLWPKDKHYFLFAEAGLAYREVAGIALVVGDPIGNKNSIEPLLTNFIEQCRINDWTVAFVHVSQRYEALYKKFGLDFQKLGEEALIDLDEFTTTTVHNKHFRNIINRFTNLKYTSQLWQPPLSAQLIADLKRVSDSWLTLAGKTERTFMLGYFDKQYLEKLTIMTVYDEHHQLVAFLNKIPTATNVANIDLMRHMADSPPNVNDFMFANFLIEMHKAGYQKVNIGLCPLAGINKATSDRSMINTMMKFVYLNGNRFFGFNGLERFKNKFKPQWEGRYLAYQDGAVGFTKAMIAVNKAMQRK